jgi:hypothetical protein
MKPRGLVAWYRADCAIVDENGRLVSLPNLVGPGALVPVSPDRAPELRLDKPGNPDADDPRDRPHVLLYGDGANESQPGPLAVPAKGKP